MIDPESWLNTLCENDQVPTQVTNIKYSMYNTVRSRIGIKTSETAAKRYGVATLSEYFTLLYFSIGFCVT